jgi:hypothetical protein
VAGVTKNEDGSDNNSGEYIRDKDTCIPNPNK